MNTQTSRSSYELITRPSAHLLKRASTTGPLHTAAAILTGNTSILFVQATSMCVYWIRVR